MSREAFDLVAGAGGRQGRRAGGGGGGRCDGGQADGGADPALPPAGAGSRASRGAAGPELPGVRVTATARVTGRTGVEMEALTAVAVACLTVYDMVKAVDRGDGHRRGPAGEQDASGLLTTHRQEEPVTATDRQVRRAGARAILERLLVRGALLLRHRRRHRRAGRLDERVKPRMRWRRRIAEPGRARVGTPGAVSSTARGRADAGQAPARSRQRDHGRTRPSTRSRPTWRRRSTTSP